MSAGGPIVELRGVSKGYGPPGEGRVEVLRAVDLAVARGESVAVVGPSGSGKSTLLHILGTLDCPDAGQVWLEGREIEGLGARELARLRNLRIGLVFQSHHLLPHLGVLENALLPAMISGDPGAPPPPARSTSVPPTRTRFRPAWTSAPGLSQSTMTADSVPG